MHSKWDKIISAHVTWINSYLPRFASLTREIFLIQVTSAEIILSHFEGIWWYFSHTFTILQMKYLENMRKPVKVEHGCRPLSFARVLRSHHVDYAHHVSYVHALRFHRIGDVRSAFIQFHIREAMRWLSHTWSGWDVFWEVYRITWLFSQKEWEKYWKEHIIWLSPNNRK